MLATLGLASSANAATTDADGFVTVTKGDIQTAMGWNNAALDDRDHCRRRRRQRRQPHHHLDVSHPVDVPGGWLTLNGQIVANYPTDEYYSQLVHQPGERCTG